MNNDGRLDVVVADLRLGQIHVLRNAGGMLILRLSVPAGANPVAIALADLDGDGVADLVAADGPGARAPLESATVWLADRLGGFGPPTSYLTGSGPAGLAVADLSRDGRPDLAVTDGTGRTVWVLTGGALLDLGD